MFLPRLSYIGTRYVVQYSDWMMDYLNCFICHPQQIFFDVKEYPPGQHELYYTYDNIMVLYSNIITKKIPS